MNAIAGNVFAKIPAVGWPRAIATAIVVPAHATGSVTAAYHSRRFGRVVAVRSRRSADPWPSCHARPRAKTVGPKARTNGRSAGGTPPNVAPAPRATLNVANAATATSPPDRAVATGRRWARGVASAGASGLNDIVGSPGTV